MKTLLIVDDEPFMRRLLQIALGNLGARILLAEHGRSALILLEKEPVDLLVIDVNMPHMDGFETLAALRAGGKQSALPVIMMTAGGEEELHAQAAGLGVAAFFSKPFNTPALAEKARALLSS